MEWTVVITLIALVGLGAAVIKPIVTLTNSITKLESSVGRLNEKVGELTDKNREAHDRIFVALRELDDRHDKLERRVSAVEQK